MFESVVDAGRKARATTTPTVKEATSRLRLLLTELENENEPTSTAKYQKGGTQIVKRSKTGESGFGLSMLSELEGRQG